jgi:multimeric flavodoxin WrbA
MLIKVLWVSGSPVTGSSTEILLDAISSAIREELADGYRVRITRVRLNELDIIPCQACGESPEPHWCFFEDALHPVYKQLASCDCLLLGTPIHFDTVSSQTKLFIDRCNCFRPADFSNRDPEHDFLKRIDRKRPGGMVLVGGKQGWFEGARRCIAGFFKWVEVVNEGKLVYKSTDFNRSGTVREDERALREAHDLGRHLADVLRDYHG